MQPVVSLNRRNQPPATIRTAAGGEPQPIDDIRGRAFLSPSTPEPVRISHGLGATTPATVR